MVQLLSSILELLLGFGGQSLLSGELGDLELPLINFLLDLVQGEGACFSIEIKLISLFHFFIIINTDDVSSSSSGNLLKSLLPECISGGSGASLSVGLGEKDFLMSFLLLNNLLLLSLIEFDFSVDTVLDFDLGAKAVEVLIEVLEVLPKFLSTGEAVEILHLLLDLNHKPLLLILNVLDIKKSVREVESVVH